MSAGVVLFLFFVCLLIAIPISTSLGIFIRYGIPIDGSTECKQWELEDERNYSTCNVLRMSGTCTDRTICIR